jgi:hypothetical protein
LFVTAGVAVVDELGSSYLLCLLALIGVLAEFS